MARRTATALTGIQAVCQDCAWTSTARNALANAARHHDAKGHTVTVEQITMTWFGDPNKPMPGQISLPT